MSVLLFLWCLFTAHAVEPTSPELRFIVGDEATAKALPRVNPKVAEVVLRDCDRNLSSILEGLNSPKIRQIFALNVQDRTWLLRIVLRNEGFHVDAVVIRGGLELWVREDRDVLQIQPPFAVTPTVEELLTKEYEKEEPFPPDLTLRFLFGEASSYQSKPHNYQLEVCQPSEGAVVSHEDVDKARAEYLESMAMGQTGLRRRGDSAYSLGWAYMRMGQAQEAAYYFSQLASSPGSKSPLCIALANAQVALHKRNWEHFRIHLQNAYRYGGDEATIVEGLAYLSLTKGTPPRGVVGRMLANLTSRPESRLLGAELLQIDGFYEDSLRILQPLYEENEFGDKPELSKRLSLRLGDAYLVAGDYINAKEVWRTAPTALQTIRYTQAMMLEKGVKFWVQSIPILSRYARNVDPSVSTEARAEALYLMGQVDTIQGTRSTAMLAWKEFLKTFSKIASKSDVGEKLWTLYALRVRSLYERKQWSKIIETHESIWTSEMKVYVEDPKILMLVAEAYEQMGLLESAWNILNVGFATLQGNKLADPSRMLYLAQLYGKIGHAVDGLETLAGIKNRGVPKNLMGDVYMLEGELFLLTKNYDKAKAAFRIAMRDPTKRMKARIHLAMAFAEANQCPEVVAQLKGVTFDEPELQATNDPYPYFTLAPCFHDQKNSPMAIKLITRGKDLAEANKSPDEVIRARYLLAEYSNKAKKVVVTENEKNSIWGKLLQEKKESQQFNQEFEDWKKKSK